MPILLVEMTNGSLVRQILCAGAKLKYRVRQSARCRGELKGAGVITSSQRLVAFKTLFLPYLFLGAPVLFRSHLESHGMERMQTGLSEHGCKGSGWVQSQSLKDVSVLPHNEYWSVALRTEQVICLSYGPQARALLPSPPLDTTY